MLVVVTARMLLVVDALAHILVVSILVVPSLIICLLKLVLIPVK